MKVKTIITIIILTISCHLMAQQNPMFTQYMYNEQSINPAYSGTSNVLSVTALYRNQWVNIEGAPKTQTLSMDTPIKDKKIGLGLAIYNDKIGVTNNFGAYTCYSYRIKIKEGTLSMGLQVGLNQFKADLKSLKLGDQSPVDQAFANNVRTLSPNFGTGIYYRTNRFYAGFSIPQIVKNNLFKNSLDNAEQFKQAVHLFLTTGYVFDVNYDIKIKPAVFVKYVKGAPVEMDLSSNVWFYDLFSVGLSYRTNDSFDAMLEVQVAKSIRLGYAYDYTLSKLNQVTVGSHEIMVRYEFNFSKAKILSPRYF
jgi:type IX secretion system PorP/SprF family membrane protein